jgi:signal peptidase I
MDKKTATILALLVLLAITGLGWVISWQRPAQERIPYNNTYKWTEIFRGYEAYLDRRITYSVVEGPSMAPTLRVGDAVLWVEVDNKAELKVGDIIIFKHPTLAGVDNVAHRIVEIVPANGDILKFRTKGDNLSAPDQQPVPEGNVHGLVIGVMYRAA